MSIFPALGLPKKPSCTYLTMAGYRWNNFPNMKGWLLPYSPAYVQLRNSLNLQKKAPTQKTGHFVRFFAHKRG